MTRDTIVWLCIVGALYCFCYVWSLVTREPEDEWPTD